MARLGGLKKHTLECGTFSGKFTMEDQASPPPPPPRGHSVLNSSLKCMRFCGIMITSPNRLDMNNYYMEEEISSMTESLEAINERLTERLCNNCAVRKIALKEAKSYFECTICKDIILPTNGACYFPCCKRALGCLNCINTWYDSHTRCPHCNSATWEIKCTELKGV